MKTDAPASKPPNPGQSSTQQFSHHVSVPGGEGERVERRVTIERPVSQVYSFWQRLENLPRFMRHVKSVTVRDDRHSHWVVRTVGDKLVEWDAEIIEQRENEMISWRSTPGADVNNAGSVWFTPTLNGIGTEVRVSLKYAPPNGKAAVVAAKLFGADADSEIQEDLNRLKSLLETGHVPPEQSIKRLQRRAAVATRRVAERTDQYIRQNPWAYIASVAAMGLLLGFVLGRAGRSNRFVRSSCDAIPN